MNECSTLKTDVCVIGGGISGICVAVTAARKGVKVILVQDRNILGGNASSEIRMWIRGAGRHFPEYAEGGLVEELALDNMYYNPKMNYSLWDGVLYNKVISEKNITLLLGTTCIDANAKDNKIESITVWELASYKKYKIEADYYADCSGDCVLAEFIDVEYMQGRESVSEYKESYAQAVSDKKTMGNSCMLQLRKSDGTDVHNPFPFERTDIQELCKNRINFSEADYKIENFWWLELGGDKDALKDALAINQELLATNFAVYSEIMRNMEHSQEKWSLDWIGFLAGKRESRRYVGDYVLTANDLENSTYFEDEIAYGGWSMDDHNPEGIYGKEPNVHYFLRKPYAIPYRCVYSKSIDNLFFAGRNISATHLANSSTRVMGTCAMIGQAVGNACAIAKKYNIPPRSVGAHILELQQALLTDGCYLLNTFRASKLEPLLNKKDYRCVLQNRERNLPDKQEVTVLEKGQRISFEFSRRHIKNIRFVFDSDLPRSYTEDVALKLFPMLCYNGLDEMRMDLPPSLVKEYIWEVKVDGIWRKHTVSANFQRLNQWDIDFEIEGIAFIGVETYGGERINIFSIDVDY